MARPIYKIAQEIKKEWAKPHYAAVPYINAMMDLSSPRDMYGMDDAKGILRYFLANASSFRGEAAKKIKAEIKEILNAS